MPLFTIPFEKNNNQTLTYHETITCYEKMAAAYPGIFHLSTSGSTDSGEPLHVAVLNTGGEFDPEKIRRSGKRILFINNGIHPGEPEGIDATVLLLRDYLEKPELQKSLEHLVLVFIPVYNVDGCLRRNSHTRANQDGPESYGFRGNARNYDLNRDFVKCDSRNARSFNAIFRTWMPDIFIDNHTSNGADYQYTMTLIATQHNKLEPPLGHFLQEKMLPELYGEMEKRKWEMTPYVDGPGETPDSGISGFCDYGRYSTGYAALWNTIGFMPETHMLKPFRDRLWSTYAFMDVVIKFIAAHHEEIGRARAAAFTHTRTKREFVLDWAMDQMMHDSIVFKGYEAKYKPSDVSGLPRLWYDRSAPYEKKIPCYNYFKPFLSVEKPVAYIIPQAWENVVERLKINGVAMRTLEKDVAIEVETSFIRDFKTRDHWEGHYYHHGIQLEKKTMKRTFSKGDFVIFTDQDANRYLLETLEPNAPDSWVAWNFFDPVLMQKEYFSGYVFEDLAAQFLQENPKIKAELDAKRAAEPEFAANPRLQLDWVYRQSPWYEPTHRMYPVARLMKAEKLPLAED
ncbi:MAG: M14 family metallopeptidase [Lewinellaceae bacterium]|nr:M14 family metallopeptidase [Lewinellaceae bacterium]